MLRYGEEMTEAQIASRLGISQRRVRYIFSAARKRLRPLGVTLPRPVHGRHQTRPASQVENETLDSDGLDFDSL